MEYLNQIKLAPVHISNYRLSSKIDIYRNTKASYCNFYASYSGRNASTSKYIYLPDVRYGEV